MSRPTGTGVIGGGAGNEGRFAQAAEDAHVPLVAEHAFEQRGTLLHLPDVVQVVQHVAKALDPAHQGVVGARLQRLPGGGVQVQAQPRHDQAGHHGERQRGAYRERIQRPAPQGCSARA